MIGLPEMERYATLDRTARWAIEPRSV